MQFAHDVRDVCILEFDCKDFNFQVYLHPNTTVENPVCMSLCTVRTRFYKVTRLSFDASCLDFCCVLQLWTDNTFVMKNAQH